MRPSPHRSTFVLSRVPRPLLRVIPTMALLLFGACAGGGDATGPGPGNGGNNGGNNGGQQNGVPSRIDLSTNVVGLGAVGASANVSAIVRDAGGVALSTAAVSWSSADITIADVSGSGSSATITARAPGSTVIRATSGAVTQELTVTVSVVRSITLPASSQVRTGASVIITPVLDADAGAATVLRWESADPTIATVSSGVVTGVQPGTTVIRVSAVGDPRVTASTQLTVTTARSVVIRTPPAELFLGDETQLTAVVDVNDGESRAVEWSTSNPTVATVTPGGKLIAVGLGTVKVRVQSAAFIGMKDSATVAVRVPRFVTVSPTTTTLGPGQTRQLSATVQIEDGMSTAVTWRTADPSVAMVSSNGLVTGVAQGTTTVTAVSVADTVRRGTATVSIVPMVRDVEVQPSAATITLGDTRQLTANVSGDAGASTEVEWRSANAAVASVSSTGLVTGVAAGATIITAVSTTDSTRQSSALITVRNAATVSLSPTSVSLEPGEQTQLSANVQVDQGMSTALSWRTSNASVVTVSGGQITAIANGTATITAVLLADTTRRGTATVTVTTQPAVRSISVSPSVSQVQAGQTVQLVPSVQVSGGASPAVTYRSDNPAVASVNFTGLVTAMANGTATITVAATADPSKTATATVTVSPTPTQLASSWTSTRLGGALHEDVVSFDAIDDNTAFAVNSKGDVFQLNGGTWSLAARGSSYGTKLMAVSATSGSNAIAVGTNGTILRFDGGSWSAMTSGTQQTLNGVYLETATSGFAVGASGLVLRLSGTSWTSMTTGSSETLYGVWSSGSIGFAVGALGEILRWNGASWSRENSGSTETLYGVYGISASSAVAVGSFGTVLRWNGSNWGTVNGGNVTADLHNVVGSTANSNRYYIASDDGLYTFNNNSLTYAITPYAPRLFGVSMDAAGNVWTSGQRGSVMRLSGSSWETLNLAPDLIDVWSTSASNAWAVGEFGFVYRWNGTSWSRQTTPTTTTLNTVWGASTSEAFAGGDDGTMLRWNGSSWSGMTFPSSGSVYGLWGTAANNVYAVTSNGEVLRFNGSSWSIVQTSSNALWAVYGSSASDVYVSGENGTALRYNGSVWSSMNVAGTGTLAGIWASSASNVLSVGSSSSGLSGVAYRYSGATWASVSMPSASMLTSAWGAHPNDVYTTGEGGLMLRWNGSSWSSQTTGTTDLLWAVSGSPTGTGGGFAVGYNSTVAAATGGSGLVASGYRALTTSRRMNLDPAPNAKRTREAMPSGKARKRSRR